MPPSGQTRGFARGSSDLERMRRVVFHLPAAMLREFGYCVSADGRSRSEIVRSLIASWVESRKAQAKILASIQDRATRQA